MDTLIEKIDHLTCPCGRPANLFRSERKEQVRYYVESHCCGIRTAPLRCKMRATVLYQHIVKVLDIDATVGAMP